MKRSNESAFHSLLYIEFARLLALSLAISPGNKWEMDIKCLHKRKSNGYISRKEKRTKEKGFDRKSLISWQKVGSKYFLPS